MLDTKVNIPIRTMSPTYREPGITLMSEPYRSNIG